MRLDDMRDETAYVVAENTFDLDALEEIWQEVHAVEEPYVTLADGYLEGLAEMVMRVALCHLDVIRNRAAESGGPGEEAKIRAMREACQIGR